jgi:hypothetical protein
MPPVEPPYRYHVFISYASEDRSWAQKLNKALRLNNFEVFLDDSRLQAGDDWNKELLDSLKASQHIVFLWSKHAAASDWVNKERLRFEILSEENNEAPKRRVIPLLLEGRPRASSHLQMISLLADAGVYGDQPDRVDEGLWESAVSKVRAALLDQENVISVPLALLTTTRSELELLDFEENAGIGDTLKQVLQHIGLGTEENLMSLYGENREQWRPFGRQENIDELLERLRLDMITQLDDVQFRWEKLGADFWSDEVSTIDREIDRLREGLSVVVVDPLALYVPRVGTRFRKISDELPRSPVLFMTPSPMEMPETQVRLRELIELRADPVYRRFYEPMVGSSSMASWYCDTNIGDEKDVKRALLATLPRHLLKRRKPAVMSLIPGV